jgi:hypothetical protein
VRIGHARVAMSSSSYIYQTCKVVPRVDLPLASESSSSSRDTGYLAAPRVPTCTCKSLLYPSMAFWSAQGVHDNIFMCARFIMTLVHSSPYTKFSNNHRLYRDTINAILHANKNYKEYHFH